MDRPLDTAVTGSPPAPAPSTVGREPSLPCPLPVLSTTPIDAPGSAAWPKSAQWTVAVLLLGVIILLGAHALAGLRAGTRPSEHVEGDGPVYRLDLNRAGAAELGQLEGIGPRLAERIVTHRKTHGLFRSINDLRQVNGIGPKIFARIQPWICVEADISGEPESVVPQRTPAADRQAATRQRPSKKKMGLTGAAINVNQASATELQRLPRIGPVLSQRIIDERAKAPFKSIDELRRVKGIGPKTLEGLRPYVTVETSSSAVAAAQP
jgi:competence protein ComEA